MSLFGVLVAAFGRCNSSLIIFLLTSTKLKKQIQDVENLLEVCTEKLVSGSIVSTLFSLNRVVHCKRAEVDFFTIGACATFMFSSKGFEGKIHGKWSAVSRKNSSDCQKRFDQILQEVG